jgi:hypothetical protein
VEFFFLLNNSNKESLVQAFRAFLAVQPIFHGLIRDPPAARRSIGFGKSQILIFLYCTYYFFILYNDLKYVI